MKRNWLIRTSANQIFGPVSREKILSLYQNGSIRENDEICMGSGFWFYVREKDFVERFVLGNEEQPYNPMNMHFKEEPGVDLTTLFQFHPNPEDLEIETHQDRSDVEIEKKLAMLQEKESSYKESKSLLLELDQTEEVSRPIEVEVRPKDILKPATTVAPIKKQVKIKNLEVPQPSVDETFFGRYFIMGISFFFFFILAMAFYFRKDLIRALFSNISEIFVSPLYAQTTLVEEKKNF